MAGAVALATLLAAMRAANARPVQSSDGVPPSILRWEVVRNAALQPRAAGGAGAVDGRQHASFQALGRSFDLDLEVNPLFAPGAKNLWVGDAGVVEEAPTITLYRGKVSGEPDSWVRVTVRNGALDGMIHTAAETYFVEPRARYFAGAAAHEMIAYRLSDTSQALDAGSCAAQHPAGHRWSNADAVAHSLREFTADSGGGAAAVTYKQATVGIVGDYAYYQAHLDKSASDMQNILNQVDGVYRSELSVTLSIAQTIVFTASGSDPWNNVCFNNFCSVHQQQSCTTNANCPSGETCVPTTDYSCLLGKFSTYHNTSGSPVYGDALAHLFTRRNLTGNVIGVAWIGSVCDNYYGSGLSEDFTTDTKSMVLLIAHEIGHNFNSPHDNVAVASSSNCGITETSACASASGGYIMNPCLFSSLNTLFTSCSKTQINGFLPSASCMTNVTLDTPSPTATATPTPTFTVPGPTSTKTAIPTATLPPTPTSTPSIPMGYWKFDEGSGTVVSDSSGLGNTGTAENGMAWGSGRVGNGGVFDGGNDDVRVANSSSLNITGTGLSIEAWVKPTAVDSYRVLVHKDQQYSLTISNGQLSYADSITWSYATIGSYGSVPAGVWSHVAVTFDGSVIRFYVNGVEVGNKARAGSLTATSNPVCLGAYGCSALQLAGTLDEVVVYARPLSASEVQAHFAAAPPLPTATGTATQTGTVTQTPTLSPVPTATVTLQPTPSVTASITQTPLDMPVPTNTVPGAPTSTLTTAPTVTFTVPPTPTLTTALATPTSTAGPAALWRFDEGAGTVVSDGSGSGNTGTAENGMAWGAGKIGNAGVFDGVNDDVRVASTTTTNVTGTGLSIEAWVKPTATDGIRVLVHKEQQYSLAISAGQLTFADSIMWSYANMGSYGTVAVGSWSHVAVTFDGSIVRFYVNGVEVGNKAHVGSIAATTNQVSLGRYNFGALPFAGSLDETALYARTLSAAEIQAHFNSANAPTVTRTATASITATATRTPSSTVGTPATATPVPPVGNWRFEEGTGTTVSDSSGSGNTGIAENGMAWGTGRIGKGGVFDGVNDDVRIGNTSTMNITGTGLSIEAWVKPTATDSIRVLVHKEQQYSLAISAGQLTFADGIMWSYANMGSYGTVPAGSWSHVAVTFDGNIVRFYINGVEVGNKAHVGSLTATTNQVCLGRYNFGSLPFAGTLDEVSVYRRALSATEVQSHFSAASDLRPPASDQASGSLNAFTVPFTVGADWLLNALKSWARN